MGASGSSSSGLGALSGSGTDSTGTDTTGSDTTGSDTTDSSTGAASSNPLSSLLGSSLTGSSAPSTSAAAVSSNATAPSIAAGAASGGNAYPDAKASTYSGGSTATDISANTGCRDLTFIFARGTTEMGTMGSVIGAPTAKALLTLVGANGASIQGVDYPASAAGNAQLGKAGSPAMVKLAQQAKQACPNTKIVLGGYSQGAMVVHAALSEVGPTNVAAIVVWGDPFNGQKFTGVDASKVLENCGSSDFLCDRGTTNASGSHLNYGSSAEKSAQFIVQATGATAAAA